VIVKAKEPFIQWLKSLPDPMDITLAKANEDSSAYLLPDYEDDDEQDEVLRRFYVPIFEEQLDGWWTEQRDWPRDRTFAQFTRWFDVEFHSLVIDLVDAPLEDEE
jgi:hypothetical protein